MTNAQSLFSEASPSLHFLDKGTWVWYGPFLLLWPRRCFEPGVCAHTWIPISFVVEICTSGVPRGPLPETHPADALVSAGGVFSGHCLVDGRAALPPLASLLHGSHCARALDIWFPESAPRPGRSKSLFTGPRSSGFLGLGAADPLGWPLLFCWGLCCAWQGVEQHPGPPPTPPQARCGCHSVTATMFPGIATCPPGQLAGPL